ncbi:MAG: tetratricopeptide repeat protein [Rivularia sp. T60_A2020_040]|nr:tetratricopeptide repeat protein [Rivularia sp. T60_A2020_040]
MDEKRLQVYFDIINQLLTNVSSEEEATTLNAEPEYVDAGLVETMIEVANGFSQQGNEDIAKFLVSAATQLADVLELSLTDFTAENQNDLLIQALLVTKETEGSPEVVYPLLHKNIELLDDKFAEVLQNWVIDAISESNTEQAEDIAATIGIFSSLIQEFPLGKRVHNLEIAIAGYEAINSLFTYDKYPEQWAATQYNLGNSYGDRINGQKAENIEKAIHCYQSALKVHTRETYPYEWATIHNNLGNVYSNRVKENKMQNLNKASEHYENALLIHTQQAYPQEWEMAQKNLAAVNQQKAERIESRE